MLTRRVDELEESVEELQAQLSEARQHNLRVAEVVDVVQELLLPLAQRDEERIAEAIRTFNRSV